MKATVTTLFLLLFASVANHLSAKKGYVYVGDICYTVNTDTGEASIEQQNYDDQQIITEAIIPSSVTYEGKSYPVVSIGYDGLYACKKLTKVVVPNSVRSLGEGAFKECPNLIEVTLPKDLKALSELVFSHCTSLKSIELPQFITSIPSHAFAYCSSLRSIVIPPNVESIGSMAFYFCSNLTSVTLPPSIKKIEGELSEINWPKIANIYISDRDAFFKIQFNGIGLFGNSSWRLYLNGTELTEVSIPDGVESSTICNRCMSFKSISTPLSMKKVELNCSDLERLTVSSATESVNNYFGALKYMACYAKTPPKLNTSVAEGAILHVPKGTKELYQESPDWAKFSQIIDDLDAGAGIDEILIDMDQPYTVYNLQGSKISGTIDLLPPGIYIIHQGNTSKKIIVK